MTAAIPAFTNHTWAERITEAWQSTIHGIFETGRLLNAAKDGPNKLPHGEFLKMVETDLPFGPRTAQMLMKVASDPRLTNTKFTSHLPPQWYTLYELTSLSDHRFYAMIESGEIHPELQQKDVAKWNWQTSRQRDEERILNLVPKPGRYRALVVDPPWEYEADLVGRARPKYATMTHEELLALPVADWAEDGCHLYLWATNSFVFRAGELMARWGFQHKTVLTWVKPRWGMGSYFRSSTEHVLFGVRGTLPTRSDSIGTHFEAPLGEHSEKPGRFYEIVREASYPPFGEIFQRQARDDFANVYGEADVSEGDSVSAFDNDNNWQRRMRDRVLAPGFYGKYAISGRYVFMDKGRFATKLQRRYAVDTILQTRDGSAICIEEKIARWKGWPRDSFFLETRSCTVPGHESTGWMTYAEADYLLYCFAQENDDLDCYLIDFPELQAWFWQHDTEFSPHRMKTENCTESRLVPIKTVRANVSSWHFRVACPRSAEAA